MKVQVDIGAKKPYTYEAPAGIKVGDPVTVPPPPWGHEPQDGTVVALGSDYAGPVELVLSGWPESPGRGLDWDMRDWGPADLVVEGLVMALEGCGRNETPVAVVSSTGRRFCVLGVRRAGRRVEIVVERRSV